MYNIVVQHLFRSEHKNKPFVNGTISICLGVFFWFFLLKISKVLSRVH